ncbi:MAG: hypothetical protein K2J80_11640 [Oscillospiraceae bacterium]|nr:hypothetical protein [Oscillospiraceae bacterium]
MKLKKIAAAMLAAAVVFGSYAAQGVGTADNASVADEETNKLSAPENLRYEGGDIKWDKIDGVYGYIVSVTDGEFEREIEYNFTDEDIEFDRLCYEYGIPLGTYSVKMCTYDASGERGEWSDEITAVYEATLPVPANVRLSEDQEQNVLWNEVEGTYRYYIQFTNTDGDVVYSSYTTYNGFDYNWNWGEDGSYLFSVYAMDKDYNVSEWSTPLEVDYICPAEGEYIHLDAPQNVRLDETGENVLWDEVAGADCYTLVVYTVAEDENGNSYYDYWYEYNIEDTCFNNWKSVALLFPNANYQISVSGSKTDVSCSNEWSDVLVIDISVDLDLDKSIAMPETIEVNDSNLKWSAVDNADIYWVNILKNGKKIYGGDVCVRAEDYSAEYGYDLDSLNYTPADTYEVELYVVDRDGVYNKKTYSVALGVPADESVWVPKVYSKYDIIWDFDQIRHDNTNGFWVRVKDAKDGMVVRLENVWSGYYYGWYDLPNGDYTIEVCAYEYGQIDKEYHYGYTVGAWSKPIEISKHDNSGFDKENEITEEVELPPEAADIPDDDKITSITINPAFNMKNKHDNDVELDLSKITIKAEAIYDEAGLKRAEEALGQTIKGNKHYNLLDLTLLYNGEDFSNGYEGLVQVIIPLPNGHRDKNFSCFRLTEVDGKMVKEVIPGEQTEDSYIIYLEHFSEYALVADANEEDEEEPVESEEPTESEEPVESEDPTESEEPTESEDPEDPEDSDETAIPATPESPVPGGSDNSSVDDNGNGSGNNTDQQPTGIALAIAPVVLAAGVVIAISKRRT